MRKNLLTIFLLCAFFIFIPKVSASFGELRYDIDEMTINGNKITFKGWAFIHKTHNFRKIYKRNESGGTSGNELSVNSKFMLLDGTEIGQTGQIKNGEQMIAIRAVDKDTKKVLQTIIVDGKENTHNFYYYMFYRGQNDPDKVATYNSSSINQCAIITNSVNVTATADYNQCYYEDIDFEITFDTSTWEINQEKNIYFEIAVHNADFQQKISAHGSDYGLTVSATSETISTKEDEITKPYVANEEKNKDFIFTGFEPLFVRKDIVDDITANQTIKVKTETASNKVKFIAIDGYMYRDNTNSSCITNPRSIGSRYYGIGYRYGRNQEDSIDKDTYFYIPDTFSQVTGASYLQGEYGLPNYKLYTQKKYSELYWHYNEGKYTQCLGKDCDKNYYMEVLDPCTETDYINDKNNKCCVFYTKGSFVKATGNTAITITVDVDKKCPVSEKPNSNFPGSGYYTGDNLKCNAKTEPGTQDIGITMKSHCDELTLSSYYDESKKANVSITEEGTLSTVLTPQNLYAGGGFKFAIIYKNIISWDFKGNPSSDVQSGINEQIIRNRIYGDKELPYLKTITFDGNDVSKYFETNCKFNKNGYNTEHRVELTCTFLLKKVVREKNGKIENYAGSASSDNKYYTPLYIDAEQLDYGIKFEIENLNRMKNSEKDSENGKNWTGGSWDKTYECAINLYDLLGKIDLGPYGTTSTNVKRIAIYRPIDINNPFPGRIPGFNWYNWWLNDSNRKRIANSFDPNKLEYTANLTSSATIQKIKEYNTSANNGSTDKDTYFQWDHINDAEKSDFVSKYVNRESR